MAAFAAVVRAPMAFFSAHPLGRIVNKFAADPSQVDELLPGELLQQNGRPPPPPPRATDESTPGSTDKNHPALN
jgi:hypothetical protein